MFELVHRANRGRVSCDPMQPALQTAGVGADCEWHRDHGPTADVSYGVYSCVSGTTICRLAPLLARTSDQHHPRRLCADGRHSAPPASPPRRADPAETSSPRCLTRMTQGSTTKAPRWREWSTIASVPLCAQGVRSQSASDQFSSVAHRRLRSVPGDGSPISTRQRSGGCPQRSN